MSEWISVKDRLPEILDHYESEVCICYLENGGFAFSKLQENIFGDCCFECERDDPMGINELMIVTHWQPLPEAPKGE